MNQILNGICHLYPDANPDDVTAMLNKAGECEIKFHPLTRPSKKVEYQVAGSWLTHDHMRNTEVYSQYLARIDAFEQRLGAKLVHPPHANWTFFGDLRGHRGHKTSLGFDWTDHPAAFDGGDTRYLVTQPYIGTQDWQECSKIGIARRWSVVLGFDQFEALPPELGFWNPPGCHVFILAKKRPIL